jgi:hypothetical protein
VIWHRLPWQKRERIRDVIAVCIREPILSAFQEGDWDSNCDHGSALAVLKHFDTSSPTEKGLEAAARYQEWMRCTQSEQLVLDDVEFNSGCVVSRPKQSDKEIQGAQCWCCRRRSAGEQIPHCESALATTRVLLVLEQVVQVVHYCRSGLAVTVYLADWMVNLVLLFWNSLYPGRVFISLLGSSVDYQKRESRLERHERAWSEQRVIGVAVHRRSRRYY